MIQTAKNLKIYSGAFCGLYCVASRWRHESHINHLFKDSFSNESLLCFSETSRVVYFGSVFISRVKIDTGQHVSYSKLAFYI